MPELAPLERRPSAASTILAGPPARGPSAAGDHAELLNRRPSLVAQAEAGRRLSLARGVIQLAGGKTAAGSHSRGRTTLGLPAGAVPRSPNVAAQALGAVMRRPSFSAAGKRSGMRAYNLLDARSRTQRVPMRAPRLDLRNAAQPHRMSYANMRDRTFEFVSNPAAGKALFQQWTGALEAGGKEWIQRYRAHQQNASSADRSEFAQLIGDATSSQQAFVAARDLVLAYPGRGNAEAFVRAANSLHSNIRSLGPHFGVNNVVQENVHLNVEPVPGQPGLTRQLTPASRQVASLPPGITSPIAVNAQGHLILIGGGTLDPAHLIAADRQRVAQHPAINIRAYDPTARFN